MAHVIQVYDPDYVKREARHISDKYLNELRSNCSELKSLNDELRQAWGSDTVDKHSYFSSSEENFVAIQKVASALDIVLDNIVNYTQLLIEESER